VERLGGKIGWKIVERLDGKWKKFNIKDEGKKQRISSIKNWV
jgi:hypothetical protein